MDMQNRLQMKNLKSIAGYLLLNRLKIGKNLDYRHKYRFQFVEQIANPAEPVNGKMNGLRPPLTASPVFADKQPRGR